MPDPQADAAALVLDAGKGADYDSGDIERDPLAVADQQRRQETGDDVDEIVGEQLDEDRPQPLGRLAVDPHRVPGRVLQQDASVAASEECDKIARDSAITYQIGALRHARE